MVKPQNGASNDWQSTVSEQQKIQEAKSLICEICRNFYQHGWVSGTGGGMSIKVGEKIVMAPSGVQKERMQESDMFVLDNKGNIIQYPQPLPPPAKPPKLSECSPLFMAAYELRGAGAVLHSHSINAVMATLLQEGYEGRGCVGEFRVTNLEMIKGIAGHGYFDECVVPVIENTARECELTASLRKAMQQYPKANAVLVKRHGVYVWGDNWIQAKTQAECYEYLFEAAVKLKGLGVDVSQAPPRPAEENEEDTSEEEESDGEPLELSAGVLESAKKKAKLAHSQKPAAIVLDIEGTVAPISFVTDTLFPYARQHLEGHLRDTFATEETQTDIKMLQAEAREASNDAAVSKPSEMATVDLQDKTAAIQAAILYVATLMAEDRKSTALKALQGHIWRQGFQRGELKSELYPDVVPCLRRWHAQGIKLYIYSSGSREAQKNLFAHTAQGDLREHLSGFFDTVVGPKVVSASYKEIALCLGVDNPADITFATDNVKEVEAAVAAGWSVGLTVRPGNPALPADARTKYRVIENMDKLLTA